MIDTPEVFYVADAHGRLDLIDRLLDKAGATKQEGRVIVQGGDLVNCVKSDITIDLETLAACEGLFDVMLIGNHEYPYYGGPEFSGFHWNEVVSHRLHAQERRVAFHVGEFLITHAGLHAMWSKEQIGEYNTAESLAELLNEEWEEAPQHPLFSDIGAVRGGWSAQGGIMWSDWMEPKMTAGFSQIVGHTPGVPRVQGQLSRVPTMKQLPKWEADHAFWENGRPLGFEPDEHFALCLDRGAGRYEQIAGCWIRDGREIEVVTIEEDE